MALKSRKMTTIFPRIVVGTTILFLRLGCDNYSRETTIQRRKLLISFFLGGVQCVHKLNCCRTMHVKVSKSHKRFFLLQINKDNKYK